LLLACLVIAMLVAFEAAGAVSLKEEGKDVDRRLIIENEYLRAVIRPAIGARIESLIHKRTGREITTPPAEGVRWGVLCDQLWQQSFWHSDFNRYPYSELIMERGPKRVRVLLTCRGKRWKGITLRKTIVVEAGRCAMDVEYGLTARKEANPRAAADLWICSGLPAGARVFLPAESGVLERPRTIETENNVFDVTRGWIAGLSKGNVGLAAIMDYSRLRNLRTCHEEATTLEWVLRKVSLKPGSTLKTGAGVMPLAGLDRVDGVHRRCAVALDTGRNPARVTVLPFESGDAGIVVSVRRLPDGAAKKLAERKVALKTDEPVSFNVNVPSADDGTRVLSCTVSFPGEEKQLSCERSFTVGKASGVHVMRPEGERIGEYPDYSTWQRYHPIDFNFNSTAIRTAHRVWARPYAGGRPKVLVIVSKHHARQAIELAQRFDLDITVPYASKRTYYALGDRYRSLNIKDVHAALEEAIVGRTFDVIITSNHDGWPLLTDKCRQHIIKLVKEKGAGFVMVQRGKVSADLADAFPVVHDWYDRGNGPWVLQKSRNPVLNALPFEALPPCWGQNGTRLRKPDPARPRPPFDILVKTRGEATIATSTWGKGRVVQMQTNGPMLPQSQTIRGRRHLEPPPFDYWEYHHALLGRLIYWAARKESPVSLRAIDCSAQSVRITTASKQAGPVEMELTLRDEFGKALHTETRKVELKAPGDTVQFAPPANIAWGCRLADVIVRNDAGTLAWGAGVFRRRGSQIKSVAIAGKVYDPGAAAEVTVSIEPAPPAGLMVQVALNDGSGRVLVKKSVAAQAETQLSLPLQRVIGPIFEVRVALADGKGRVLDQGFASGRIKVDREPYRAKFQTFFWGGTGGTFPSYLIREWLQRYRYVGMSADSESDGPLMHSRRELEHLNMPYICGSIGMAARGGVKKADMEKKADVNPFTSPVRWEAQKKAAARRAKERLDWVVLMHTMGDENRVYTKDVDYSKAGLAQLRKWLKESQYKSLSDLNAEWKTAFKSWDEVMPMTEAEIREHAKQTGSYAAWADQQQFNKWAYARMARYAMDGFLSVDPKARAGTSGTQEPSAYGGRDWWLLARAYTALAAYGGEQASQHISYNPDMLRYPWAGYGKPNPILRTSTWRRLRDSNHGIGFFHWATHIDPDLTLPECGRDLHAMLLEMIYGQGQLMIEAKPLPADIYFMQSSQSIHGAYILGRAATARAARTNLMTVMDDLARSYRHISYEQVASGELGRIGPKVLFLPHIVALSEAEAGAIRNWVRAGGTLIADIGAGTMTQHCRPLKKGRLDDVFGIDRSAAAPKAGKWTVAAGGVSFPVTVVETGLKGAARAAWTAGEGDAKAPVFFGNNFGKGRAFYFACDLLGAYAAARKGSTESEGYKAFLVIQNAIDGILREADCPAPVVALGAKGAATRETFLRIYPKTTGGADRYFIVTRDQGVTGASLSDRPATLVFDRKGYLYDTLAGRALGYGDRLDLMLNDNTVRLIALLPYQVTGLDVAGPADVRAGEDVSLGLSVRAGGKPGVHVCRVDVVDPKGAFHRTYSENVVARDGKSEVILPFALNDAAGAWTVHVRDVATGVSATKVIELKAAE